MELNHEAEAIANLKKVLSEEKLIEYELQGVYGVYDIIVKITSETNDEIRRIALEKIKGIEHIQSAITMMVNQN